MKYEYDVHIVPGAFIESLEKRGKAIKDKMNSPDFIMRAEAGWELWQVNTNDHVLNGTIYIFRRPKA